MFAQRVSLFGLARPPKRRIHLQRRPRQQRTLRRLEVVVPVYCYRKTRPDAACAQTCREQTRARKVGSLQLTAQTGSTRWEQGEIYDAATQPEYARSCHV